MMVCINMLVLALVMDYFKTEAQPILDRWMTNNASISSFDPYFSLYIMINRI